MTERLRGDLHPRDQATDPQADPVRFIYNAMRRMGDREIANRMDQQIKTGNASATPPGAKIVANAARVMRQQVLEWREQNEPFRKGSNQEVIDGLLEDFGLDDICVFVSMSIVDHLAQANLGQNTEGYMRGVIANAILKERDFRSIEQAMPGMVRWQEKQLKGRGQRGMDRFMKRHLGRLNDDQRSGWTKGDAEMVSKLLIESAVISGVIEIKTERVPDTNDKRKWVTRRVAHLHPEVDAWLMDALATVPQVSPTRFPVPHRPVDWSPEGGGGYLPTLFPQQRFVTGRGENFSGEDMLRCPVVVDSVNKLQETAWQTNHFVVDAVRYAIVQGWTDVGLPVSVGDEPVAPEGEWDHKDPAWKNFGIAQRRWKEASHAEKLGRRRLARTLSTVNLFDQLPENRYYMVWQLCWRSRAYAVASSLSPQGPDVQRGILRFADGKPLGPRGLRHLLFHAGNCYGGGVEKQSIEGRVRWADKNLAEIMSCGRDFKDNSAFWRGADEPFQFLAVCQEIAGALDSEDPTQFVSKIPIAVDGSSNGLQNLSLAMRDRAGAEATNCCPLESPNDIYSDVARAFRLLLEESAKTGDSKHARWSREFLAFIKTHVDPEKGHVPRKWAKKASMVLPYSAKLYSLQEDLASHYHAVVKDMRLPESQRPFSGNDTYPALNWLASQMKAAVGKVVVRAFEVMDWLQKVAMAANKKQIHLQWDTPLGFNIRQNYVRNRESSFKFGSLNGKMAKGRWSERDETRFNGNRSKNGIVPNLIHGLDATAVHLTTMLMSDALGGDAQLSMIHDSFATTAADMDLLSHCLRRAYTDIYSQDVLEAFETQVRALLPEDVELPPRPAYGDLDVSELLQADYFFA